MIFLIILIVLLAVAVVGFSLGFSQPRQTETVRSVP